MPRYVLTHVTASLCLTPIRVVIVSHQPRTRSIHLLIEPLDCLPCQLTSPVVHSHLVRTRSAGRGWQLQRGRLKRASTVLATWSLAQIEDRLARPRLSILAIELGSSFVSLPLRGLLSSTALYPISPPFQLLIVSSLGRVLSTEVGDC